MSISSELFNDSSVLIIFYSVPINFETDLETLLLKCLNCLLRSFSRVYIGKWCFLFNVHKILIFLTNLHEARETQIKYLVAHMIQNTETLFCSEG